jgi:hypothetical protein
MGASMKILLLSHDLDLAKNWIDAHEISDMIILDERQLGNLNPKKFSGGFKNINYSNMMVEEMRIKRMSWKSSRPLVMLMDMRHQTAVDQISHDMSILLYDNSLSRRIVYNPLYKTDHLVNDFNEKLLQNLLQISV